MEQGKNRRHGKIVPGSHSKRVSGLGKFLETLEQWPEITSIRLGRIQNSTGRKAKNNLTTKANKGKPQDPQMSKSVKKAKFSFKATGYARVGPRITGITCQARDTTCVQRVILCGDDLEVLKQRLHKEGYSSDW